MQAIRTRVRAVALAWLLCQAASLAAFVPEHCCISHFEEAAAREKAKADACHESEAPKPEPADACPMDHGDSAACPMHGSKSQDCCVMTNACDGPGTNLASLFAYLGAIERPMTAAIALESAAAVIPPATAPLHQDITPDSPPPKA